MGLVEWRLVGKDKDQNELSKQEKSASGNQSFVREVK